MPLFEFCDALAIVFNIMASVNVFKKYFVWSTLSTFCLVIRLVAGLTNFGYFYSVEINGLITFLDFQSISKGCPR